MRQCLETFLMLLSDNLTNIPVHNVRVDPSIEGSDQLQMNCINVQIVRPVFGNPANASTLQVSLDVINDSELVALDWAQSLTAILQKGGYAPKVAYTFNGQGNITGQTPVGSNIWWEPKVIAFRPVKAEEAYSRFTCLFQINHIIS